MTNTASAFTVENIGGACPTQAEGRYTESDRPYYFRARHGAWSLTIGDPGWPTDYLAWPKVDPATHPPIEHTAEGEDPTHGWMEESDVLAIIAANVPPLLIEGEVEPS